MNNNLIAINIVTAKSRKQDPDTVIIPEKALSFADFLPGVPLQMKIYKNKIVITSVPNLSARIAASITQ